jgi:2-(1,2-epoxy-1,2-dihydrophenyl)acetyl-CoA isomerase
MRPRIVNEQEKSIMPEPIKVHVSGKIAVVLLNRPKAFNSFDLDTIRILAERLVGVSADSNIRAAVISGEGNVFCSGGDLKWASGWEQGYASAFYHLAGAYHQAILEIRRMRKPVVAAINGIAAGGGFSLALACDFRVMAESAFLRQAYTSNGLSIDGGGTFTLPRIVGLARALEIAAFDRPISSQQALEWGLATRVVPDGNALDEGVKMAHELVQKSLHSFASSKQLLNDSFSNSFETHLEQERTALRSAASHPEGKEGVTAFVEKRRPVFV